jgi:hypothetical protein
MASLKLKIQRWDSNPQCGSSLIAVLVAMGIMGIITAILAQTFRNNLQMTSKVQIRGELEDLRRYIRISISCEKTFATNNCNGGPISILSAQGLKPVIERSGNFHDRHATKLGGYTLLAKCDIDNASLARVISVTYQRENEKTATDLFSPVRLMYGEQCNQ